MGVQRRRLYGVHTVRDEIFKDGSRLGREREEERGVVVMMLRGDGENDGGRCQLGWLKNVDWMNV